LSFNFCVSIIIINSNSNISKLFLFLLSCILSKKFLLRDRIAETKGGDIDKIDCGKKEAILCREIFQEKGRNKKELSKKKEDKT